MIIRIMKNTSPPLDLQNKPRRQRVRQRQGVIAALTQARASILPQPPQADIDVGNRLRELRIQHGLSIRGLAEISTLNANTLSLIENNKSSPSVSTLQQLARALRVPISAFFAMDQPRQTIVFQKNDHRSRLSFNSGYLEDLGSGMTLAGGQPLLVTLQPGADSGPDPVVHTGYEFVYCLQGSLQYRIADALYELQPGDSLLFEAHQPHRWGNTAALTSRSLLILCPTDENDHPTECHFITPENFNPQGVLKK